MDYGSCPNFENFYVSEYFIYYIFAFYCLKLQMFLSSVLATTGHGKWSQSKINCFHFHFRFSLLPWQRCSVQEQTGYWSLNVRNCCRNCNGRGSRGWGVFWAFGKGSKVCSSSTTHLRTGFCSAWPPDSHLHEISSLLWLIHWWIQNPTGDELLWESAHSIALMWQVNTQDRHFQSHSIHMYSLLLYRGHISQDKNSNR